MAQDWDIKSRGSKCDACERNFEDMEVCYSFLHYGEDGYARTDCCADCREKVQAQGIVVSAWQGIYRKPAPPPEDPLKQESAEDMLRRMMEDEDEANDPVRFILAVMLERKKMLIERNVQKVDAGRLIRVYEHKRTGETFIIHDPSLSLDELEPIQERVVELLGGNKKGEEEKTEQPAPPPSADTAAAEVNTDGLKDGFYSAADS